MSHKEPTKLVIGKNTYIIGNWDVDKALEILVWLTKTFGEGLLTIFMSEDGLEAVRGMVDDGKEKSSDEEAKEKELVAEFAEKLINRLDAKEYVKYAKIIVSGTRCNGEAIDFKFHFVGRMGELHQVLFAVLKHQYSDFLAGSGDDT